MGNFSKFSHVIVDIYKNIDNLLSSLSQSQYKCVKLLVGKRILHKTIINQIEMEKYKKKEKEQDQKPIKYLIYVRNHKTIEPF